MELFQREGTLEKRNTVLFVCEHGAAKSVIAAAFFNRLAAERQIALRAVARGTNPDVAIAPNAVRGLSVDGIESDSGAPTRLTDADLETAARVVAFCPLPDIDDRACRIDVWEDVPQVGEGYERARDAIVERVVRLVDEFAARPGDSGGLAS